MDKPKLAIEQAVFTFAGGDKSDGLHKTEGLNKIIWDECAYCGDKQLRSLRHSKGWTHDQCGVCCLSCLRWSDDAYSRETLYL